MAVLLDQFLETLSSSGLMTKAEVARLIDRVPESEKPKTGEEMATILYRHGRLTKFQAQAIYRGKAKGLILGQYVILDLIGQGGMGKVYKAQHRHMKRTVAVKILPPEMTTSSEGVHRFQQEVEAAARLIHPNVATAFDAGEDKKTHFLVMEFVEGSDLATVVTRRGKLPLAQAVDYILQAARGLAYAHSQGVIHRDIKPSNLMLDKQGTVKILDLGLARIDRKQETLQQTLSRGLTQSGDVMGTVDFMSPEQAASSKRVDERTDIYSLGCTLFYLLVGHAVYEGDTLVERVLAHREKPIPSLKTLRADAPQSLVTVFRRMVAKKPELRFSSMKEVISAIEKCELPQDSPTPAKPASVSTPSGETHPPQRAETIGPQGTHSSAPPPPSVTPRNREPVRVDKTTRAKKTLAQMKVAQQKEERKQVWADTVKDAIRDQERKARWEKIRRFFNEGIAGLVKWGLLLAVIAGAVFGGNYLWQNTQKLQESQDRVLANVNHALNRAGYEPLDSIQFVNASPLRPPPPTLTFESPLWKKDGDESRPTKPLQGEFQRVDGLIQIQEPFRMRITVEPIP
jgi:serine/threonine protein kinase